jgi:hypothetical protein
MSFVSLADSCRQLGIDAKTLRRWLADAQLPLQSHRSDGRKKGVSRQHLQQLAALHHRSLPALASAAPAATGAACSLPADLLALPEQLACLQAQLAALQQQVSVLTHLMQQQVPKPCLAASAAKPLSPPAPPAAPAAAASKPAHILARVEYVGEGHYVLICPKQGVLALEPDSPAWFAWLAKQSSFRFVGKQGRLTAHCDAGRGSRIAWRAHRKIRNPTYNLPLARTGELTFAVLEQAAGTLQAHLN